MRSAGPVSSTQFVHYRLTIMCRWFIVILTMISSHPEIKWRHLCPLRFLCSKVILSSAITIYYVSVEWEARSWEGQMLKNQLKSSRQYPSSGRGNEDVSPGIALRVMWVTDAHETWYRRGASIWSPKTKSNWGSRDEMLVPQKRLARFSASLVTRGQAHP